MTKYNGWVDRATWNIALHMCNDEGLYNLALRCEDYSDYKNSLAEVSITETADGVPLAKGSAKELTECILELRE